MTRGPSLYSRDIKLADVACVSVCGVSPDALIHSEGKPSFVEGKVVSLDSEGRSSATTIRALLHGDGSGGLSDAMTGETGHPGYTCEGRGK